VKNKNLDYIEHGLIRKKYNEPRIHFALVCASVGCPALRREAYIDQKLESQLEDAAVRFLSDKSKNRYLPESHRIELSSLFDWYGDDFVKKFGSIESFIATRMTTNLEEQKSIRNKSAEIIYLSYDWALNE